MNIALVIFRGEEQRGGAERYTADIAAALGARGHGVVLLSTRFGREIPGVNFVPIAAQSPTRAGRYMEFLDHLDAHLAGRTYDLVHSMLPVRRCDLYHPHAGMAKAAMARLIDRLNRKRRLFAQVEDELIHGPQKPIVLCLSDYVKAMILRHYPDISDQLVTLFNGTDLTRFDPADHAAARKTIRERFGIPLGATTALMIAQYFERKGLAEVIAATANIAKTSAGAAPFVVVVGKDDPARGRQQAKRLGVQDRIIFAGQTDSAADFYAACDFFVLPTRHDSCSLVALEALAMGLPVISTVFNGACEIMTDGRHGYVLPDPADVEALTTAMSNLLDPDTRQRMSQACLALRPRLSFEAHVDRLEEIYRARFKSTGHV
ncbi:MAG: glycosyltransferase family 4 protein [Tepidisphaeraceae bacterium]|jgi:UDP-glucose:(heptosyl)LPS alpha-1,3-glucosyltransferase